MDILQTFRVWATQVADALNEKGVKPIEPPHGGNVMVVVFDLDASPDNPPFGGAVVWEDDEWVVLEQLEPAVRVDE